MNRLKSSMLIVLAVVMTTGFAIVPTKSAEAQGSAALSISPRKDYVIEPGKEANDTLLIRNIDSERPLILSLTVADFTFNDETGTPKITLDQEVEPTPWSLKSFIDIPKQVTIEPGESTSVPVKVAIPANQGAGSYYSAIVYSSTSSDGGNVGLSASGVSLMFVTVPGEVDENLTLKKLGAYDPLALNKDGKKGVYKPFNMEMPLNIGYTLINQGSVAESPTGSITLKNVLFGKEVTINDANPNKSLALIGQTRTFSVCIKQTKEEVEFDGSREEATKCSEDTGLWPGLYRVEFSGFYGWNGNATQEIVGKAWMLYTPWWFLVIALVVLLVIAYQGWKLWRFIQLKRGGGKKYVAQGKK